MTHPPQRLALAVSLVGALLLSGCGTEEPADPTRPRNLVLISVDTLGLEWMRAFDPEAQNLPTLDRLAAQSRRFSRAHSTAGWTLPAHASVLTGLYPASHGAAGQNLPISSKVETLTECMREAGFDTAAFTDGGFLTTDYDVSRGFQVFEINTPAWRRRPDAYLASIEFLSRRKSRRPLFLFTHSYQLHDYFKNHPWAVADLEPFEDLGPKGNKACLDEPRKCNAEQWRRLKDLYRVEVRAMDEALGRLLSHLQAQGLLDDSLVVLMSDHGEGFEPGLERVYHTGRLHSDLLRVPLLFYGPGVVPGESDELVSLVDIFPTIEDVFGLSCRGSREGRSLARALRGRDLPTDRVVYADDYFYYWEDGKKVKLQTQEAHSRAVIRSDGMWLIDGKAGLELYDVTRDPRQHQNLVDGEPSAENPLLHELMKLLEGRGVLKETSEAFEPDAELLEQLESLGYL